MSQFAYRKLHSTITSLISISDYWYENIDKNNVNFALIPRFKESIRHSRPRNTYQEDASIRNKGHRGNSLDHTLKTVDNIAL